MHNDPAIQELIDREAIRDLVLCYSRAIDRKDVGLLRDLYTEDSTDTHGDTFDGSAEDFCKFIEGSLPHMTYSGHHACNHMIAIDGDEGNGEVYALAFHVVPDQANLPIIESASTKLDIPMERVAVNIERVGNTSSGSIPMALDDVALHGRVRQGDPVMLGRFGTGVSWAGALLRWDGA